MATLAARQLPAFPDIACLLASFILVNFYLVSQRREKIPQLQLQLQIQLQFPSGLHPEILSD